MIKIQKMEILAETQKLQKNTKFKIKIVNNNWEQLLSGKGHQFWFLTQLTLFEVGGLFSPPLRENIYKSIWKWFFGAKSQI